jgi:hypothetical protein
LAKLEKDFLKSVKTGFSGGFMKQKKLLLAFLMMSACRFTFAQGNPPSNPQTMSMAKIIEGTIMSINIDQNMFVMKARISKVDTLHLGNSAIIKAGPVSATRKDLKPNSYIKAGYEMKKGEKQATYIMTFPEGSFRPDTSELGKNSLIAEGTISSINEAGTIMIISAPLEKEYIFSLDSAAVIKSGKKSIQLKDLKPYGDIKAKYSEKASGKTVSPASDTSK